MQNQCSGTSTCNMPEARLNTTVESRATKIERAKLPHAFQKLVTTTYVLYIIVTAVDIFELACKLQWKFCAFQKVAN